MPIDKKEINASRGPIFCGTLMLQYIDSQQLPLSGVGPLFEFKLSIQETTLQYVKAYKMRIGNPQIGIQICFCLLLTKDLKFVHTRILVDGERAYVYVELEKRSSYLPPIYFDQTLSQ